MYKIIGITLLCFFFGLQTAFCGQPTYFSYTTSTGLPSNEIYDITSDELNNIWITTDRGIVKFDGNSFKVFTQADGLADNTNFYFAKGRDNKLWLSGFNRELSIVQKDSIQQFQGNENLSKFLLRKLSSWIRYIDEIDENLIFIPYKNKAGVEIFTSSSDGNLVPVNKNQYNILEGDSDNKFVKLNSDYYFFYLDYITELDSVFGVSKAIPDKEGNVYFSDRKSIYRKDANLNTTYSFDFPYLVEKIFCDSNSNLWVCTRGGLYFFDRNKFNSEPKILFKEILISAVAQDFQGNIWIGTNDDGVKVIPDIEMENILDANALCLIEFNDELVVGTTKSGIGVINKNGDSQLIEISEGKNNIQVSKFGLWDDSALSLNGGYLYDGKKLEKNKDHLLNDFALRDYGERLNNGELFLISSNAGFSVYITEFNTTVKEYQKKEIGFNETITTFLQDYTDKIWLGTRTGLFRIDDYDYFNCIPVTDKNQKPLGRVSDLFIDHNNVLFITTIGEGAYVLKKDELLNISDKTELSNLMVNQALVTNDSILWLATNKGIDVFKYQWRDTLKINFLKNINNSDGLVSNYVNDIKFWNGYIWAATNNGICRFKPDIINREVPQIPVYITNFENQDSTYNLDQDFNFKHDQNDILISYSGLSFKQQNKKIQYKYRLNKNNNTDESQWYITYDRNQRFNDLLPGDYRFEVNAENALRIWNDKPASISFTIKPHYTQTFAFKISLAALGLLTIFIIYRFQLKRIKRKERNEKQLAEAKLKTQEAELAAIRNQMNPHFVYNSLNSIQNLIFKNDKMGANRYMSKFAKLMRQSLQFTQLDFINLEKEIQFLTNYLDLEALRFPGKFRPSFEISDDIMPSQVLIPSLILQPIVENSIKHGFNDIDYEGIIRIRVEILEDDMIQLTISDNGQGLKSKSKSANNKDAFHESIGIELVKTRLDLLNSAEFKGKASIEEQSTEHGYTTKITIPLITPMQNEKAALLRK